MESTAHDLRSQNTLLQSIKTKFLRECDGIIVPGTSSYAYALSFNVPRDRIFTAPNAVDVNLFSRKAELARQNRTELHTRLALPSRYFLFVGRLVREKGVFDLLNAYASLPSDTGRDVSLVFVGEGAAKAELSRRAASISGAVIQFRGFVQRDDLPSYYALADTFVFPTHSDPWGLVINEAMSSGLPIICSSAAGCCADLVQDGRNGRVVPPHEVSQLRDALAECTDSAEISLLRGECSSQIISQFTPENCARGLAEAALAFAPVCYG
jgi:glycosyltransferase involved in cell wall biosynthesis